MDWLIVEEKLESLRRCVACVGEKRVGSADLLRQDPDIQDILTLNLTRAIQLCVNIATHVVVDSGITPPGTMGESFDRLRETSFIIDVLCTRLKAAVGFRNIAIHNYEAIDGEIVHAIATDRLQDFRDFARAIHERTK